MLLRGCRGGGGLIDNEKMIHNTNMGVIWRTHE